MGGLSVCLSVVSLPRALDICDPCQKPPAGWATQVAYRRSCGGRIVHSVSASTNSCHRGPAWATEHGADADIALAMQSVTVWPCGGHSAWGRRRHCTGHAVSHGVALRGSLSMGQTSALHWPCSHGVASRGSAWGPAGSLSIAWPRGGQHGADHGRHCTAMQSVTVWPRGGQHGADADTALAGHGRSKLIIQSESLAGTAA